MGDMDFYGGASINGDIKATGKLKGSQATAAGEAPVLGANNKVPASLVDLSGCVPTTRKVNGHQLNSDVTVTAGDIGAIPQGGTLTKPLTATGGDQASAGKIILNQANKGQITDSSTSTLLGFNDASTLMVGSSSYATAIRGSSTHPTYNSKSMVLSDDLAPYVKSTDSVATDGDMGQTFGGHTASEFLLKTDASSTYLSKTDASSTYLPKTNASSTYLSKTDASSTYLPKSGGSLNGVLTAQNNTNYTTKQVRNITLSTSAPSGGSNGDIWIQYE